MKYCLLLRGHIRSSFQSLHLLEFLKLLVNTFDIDIYIHTWNVSEGSYSWRPLPPNKLPVAIHDIQRYFMPILSNIKHIEIEDENVPLNGKLDGMIGGTPLIGWKQMWYGIHKCMTHVPDDVYDVCINTRFDLFQVEQNNIVNKDLFRYENLIYFIHSIDPKNGITFLTHHLIYGIDNFYGGNMDDMGWLIGNFHTNLDDYVKYLPSKHQEFLVPIIAKILFK